MTTMPKPNLNAKQLKRQRYLLRRTKRRQDAEHVKNVLFEATLRHVIAKAKG